jgi:hypothetical protein
METEQTTETPTTPTEGATSSEAAASSLLTSTEPAATPEQQPSEQPKEGEKPAEGAKPAEEAKPEGAPESYDFTAPEGKEYDAAVLEPFKAAAKEANLTQDAAQKLLDTMAPALAERQAEQVKAVQDGWLEASRSDKEFGGDKLQENLAVAKKGLDAYASPELKTLLNETGLGSHPEVIRFMFKVGQSTKEDSFVAGGTPKGAADITKSLYPNTPSKE